MADDVLQRWDAVAGRWVELRDAPAPGTVYRRLPKDVNAAWAFNPSPRRTLPPVLGADGRLHSAWERVEYPGPFRAQEDE